MARPKSPQRSPLTHRTLHLESFEARLALSAAESPAAEFQFGGQLLEQWINEQKASDTVVIAPAAPPQFSAETIQNLFSIVGAIETRPAGMITLDRVRDWLDRRGAEFNFTLPETDGGVIDLSGPADFSNAGELGSYEEPGIGELFGSTVGPAAPGEIGSLEGSLPATSQGPVEPGSQGVQGGGVGLEAWSSLGRPAVIPTEEAGTSPPGASDVKYARANEVGGWIALEPILAQTDASTSESLRLASPQGRDQEPGSAAPELELPREEALAGEWARAAVFEMIGGDPSESRPAARTLPGRNTDLNQGETPLSDSDAPATTLGAATIPASAVAWLAESGWFEQLSHWVQARAGAAMDNLFAAQEDRGGGTLGGWRDYASAGTLLLAIALERLAANHREEMQTPEAARIEKLRLRRAELTHRLAMRLKPMETR